jgi:hypothetical protein
MGLLQRTMHTQCIGADVALIVSLGAITLLKDGAGSPKGAKQALWSRSV